MVLVCDRSPEQREDAIAGRLHDITVVAMGGVHHQLERGIDHRARLLGIEILHYLGGPLDIGEQRRDGLPLTVERIRRAVFRSNSNTYRTCGRWGARLRCGARSTTP